ncbi:MAG: FAD-binding oxidoreductase [Pseudomonadota bacterium]
MAGTGVARLTTDIPAALRDSLAADAWLTGEAMQPFLTEWRGDYESNALAVALPTTTADVVAVVRACAREKIGIVPQGGNTGLCGGAVATSDQIILSTQRMNRVTALSTKDNCITVQSGCTLQQAKQAALVADRFLPLSLSAEGSCQVGGNLATNAGGVNFLKYGGARDQTLGLEVVLANGQVMDGCSPLRKNNSGYDWKHWFIGAEGTLGIITGAALKLWSLPERRCVVWLGFDSFDGLLDCFKATREAFSNTLAAFELIGRRALDFVTRHVVTESPPIALSHPWHALIEIHGSHYEVDTDKVLAFFAGGQAGAVIQDAVVATSERDAERLWRFRHAISEAQRSEGISIKHDIALPLESMSEFVSQTDGVLQSIAPGCRVVCFGHVGDGNLHYNISQPTDMPAAEFDKMRDVIQQSVHETVLQHGGSVSAEHGIGLKKRALLEAQVGTTALQAMHSLKRGLDPENLMNPGKVL